MQYVTLFISGSLLPKTCSGTPSSCSEVKVFLWTSFDKEKVNINKNKDLATRCPLLRGDPHVSNSNLCYCLNHKFHSRKGKEVCLQTSSLLKGEKVFGRKTLSSLCQVTVGAKVTPLPDQAWWCMQRNLVWKRSVWQFCGQVLTEPEGI